jgi:hypothetical protein
VELWLYDGTKGLKNDQGSHFAATVPYKSGTEIDAQLYVTAPDSDTDITVFTYGWGAPPS